MIIPIGQPFKRGQVLYVYTKDAEGKIHSRRDIGVFFIPMTGAIQKSQPVRPETVSAEKPSGEKPAVQGDVVPGQEDKPTSE
jgi:protein-L-isoaspartate(D-aspartate) O-methyltransferase